VRNWARRKIWISAGFTSIFFKKVGRLNKQRRPETLKVDRKKPEWEIARRKKAHMTKPLAPVTTLAFSDAWPTPQYRRAQGKNSVFDYS
jgi:hypothetical protein